MFKMLLIAVGVSFSSMACADAPQSCPSLMSGKVSCVSGEKMLCNKEFDSTINDFRYEWHALNENGQTFDVYSPFYKKLPGYTPVKCADPVPRESKAGVRHS